MMLQFQEYHQELLIAIDHHHQSERPEMERIEACFKTSLDHWGKVQREIRLTGFESAEEEIQFFKHIKPLFTSYIEYYTCRYHALLFSPGEEEAELARFWKWELRKIEKFYEMHHEICQYVRAGRTEQDAELFMRERNNQMQVVTGRVHDLDPGTSTQGDHVVTMMRAYELYQAYIHGEMQKLGGFFFVTK